MKRETGGISALTLLVLAAALMRGGSASSPTPAPEPRVQINAKTVAKKPALAAAPATPNSEPPPKPTAPNPWDAVAADLDDFRRHPGAVVEAVVATVPDPLDAHDGWMFDEYVDAIERAVEDVGFNLTQHWLPWDELRRIDDDKKRSDRRRDFGMHAGRLVFHRRADAQPGAPERALVLLLVGETPTGGVDPTTLGGAIQEAAALGAPGATLRILGPNYSGSADSLAAVLRANPMAFTVVSGTATTVNVDRLRTDAAPATVEFHATVLSDDVLRAGLCRYLTDRGVQPNLTTAMLVESTTVYGQQPGVTSTDCKARLFVPFAMQLSQTRSAYERDAALKQKVTKDLPDEPRQGLELSLDDAGTANDLVQSQAPAMTAAINELMLGSVLSAISHEDIQYVGILATDTRDKLFLSRKLRESTPNVRLFTFEGDLLYTHRDYREYLEGMLVVSAYPLFARTQILGPRAWWDGRVAGLTTQGAQGVYNATLALLGSPERLIDYRNPLRRDPGEPFVPQIWISAVGHDGLWPLSVYSPTAFSIFNDHASYTYSLPPQKLPESAAPLVSFPSVSGLVLLILSAACIGQSSMMRREHAWNPSAALRRWQWLSLLTVVAAVGIAAIGCVVEASAVATLDWKGPGGFPGPRAALLGSALMVLFALWRAGLFASLERPARVVGGVVVFAAVVATLVWGSVWLDALVRRRVSDFVFSLERNTDPTSGLSVAVPIACVALALYLWCWSHARRNRLRLEQGTLNPLAQAAMADPTLGVRGFAELQERVDRWSARPCFTLCTWRYRWVLVVVLGTFGAIAWSQAWQRIGAGAMLTLEGPAFDVPFFLAGTGVQVIVIVAGARIIGTWIDLRALLRAIAFHPVEDVCGRLPDRLKRTLRTHFYAYVPAIPDFRPGLQRWRVLMEKLPELRTELLKVMARRDPAPGDAAAHEARLDALGIPDATAPSLDDLFQEALANEERLRRPVSRDLSIALATRASALASILHHVWDRRRSGPGAPLPSGSPDKRTSVDEWLDQAQEFVAVNVVLSVTYACEQLRTVGVFLLSSALLLLLANTSYSFQPAQLFAATAQTTVGATIVILAWIFIGMERDELLSRASGTDGKGLTFDQSFVTKIVTVVVLPLATMVASRVPQVGRVLGELLKFLR